MRTLILFVVALFHVSQMRAQAGIQELHEISQSFKLFTSDKAGNIFAVNNRNVVYKYSENGDSLAQFSAIKYGEITSIDATNPLRVLLYCANQQQVLLLDRMLSLKNVLDLKDVNLYIASTVAMSIDGNLWVYDPFKNMINKYDDNLKIQNTSLLLRQSLHKSVNASFICEQDRHLFVVDTTIGILSFDQFGNYYTTYHYTPEKLQFMQKRIVFYTKGKLRSYDIESLQEKELDIPFADVVDARIENGRLYILTNNSIKICTIVP